jgi:hypothetical protein
MRAFAMLSKADAVMQRHAAVLQVLWTAGATTVATFTRDLHEATQQPEHISPAALSFQQQQPHGSLFMDDDAAADSNRTIDFPSSWNVPPSSSAAALLPAQHSSDATAATTTPLVQARTEERGGDGSQERRSRQSNPLLQPLDTSMSTTAVMPPSLDGHSQSMTDNRSQQRMVPAGATPQQHDGSNAQGGPVEDSPMPRTHVVQGDVRAGGARRHTPVDRPVSTTGVADVAASIGDSELDFVSILQAELQSALLDTVTGDPQHEGTPPTASHTAMAAEMSRVSVVVVKGPVAFGLLDGGLRVNVVGPAADVAERLAMTRGTGVWTACLARGADVQRP